MLILTRKPGESIMIGDDIRVTVVRIQGQQIGIGVDAPNDVSVDREEVRARKEAGSEIGNDPHNR